MTFVGDRYFEIVEIFNLKMGLDDRHTFTYRKIMTIKEQLICEIEQAPE